MLRTLCLILTAALAGGGAGAQEFPVFDRPLPVATLNLQQLLVRSKFGQELDAIISRAQQTHASENARLFEELETEERDLTERRSALTPEEFAPLATAFDEKVVRIRRERDAKLVEISELAEAGRQSFEQAAVPLIRAEMQRRGIVYILDPQAVLYSFGGQDITDPVLAALDLEYDAGNLQLPDF